MPTPSTDSGVWFQPRCQIVAVAVLKPVLSLGMKCYKLIRGHKCFKHTRPDIELHVARTAAGLAGGNVRLALQQPSGTFNGHQRDTALLPVHSFCMVANGISASCRPVVTTSDTICSPIQKINQGLASFQRRATDWVLSCCCLPSYWGCAHTWWKLITTFCSQEKLHFSCSMFKYCITGA